MNRASKTYFEDRDSLVKYFSFGKVLDVGCTEKRFDVAGSVGIDTARSQNVDFVAAAQYLPFKNETFDTIIAGELIEHLVDPYLFANETKRVLVPKGRLILTTPNPTSIHYIFHESFGLKSVSDTCDHKYLWDLKCLRRFLTSCGFRIEAVGYVNIFRKFVPKILVRFNKRWSWHIFIIAQKRFVTNRV